MIAPHARSIPAVYLAILMLAIGSGPPAAAQEEAELLFHAPFDGSVDAEVAAGEARGTLTQITGYSDQRSDEPVFGDGIRGKALEIGQYGYRIEYDPAGNIDKERGTLMFWARRLGQQPDERYTYHYLRWEQGDGSWVMIYNWKWTPLTAMHGHRGSGDIGVHFPGDRDDDGDWHQIALTWDDRRVRAFFDGDPVPGKGQVENFPLVGFASFRIGPGIGRPCRSLPANVPR